MSASAREGTGVFAGIPVSRGFASGRVCLVHPARGSVVSDKPIGEEHAAAEVKRLKDAFAATKAQIAGLAGALKQEADSNAAAIFDGHLMIVDDPFFFDTCQRDVTLRLRNAEWAVNETARKFATLFANMDDPYLRERAKDVGDIAKRILNNLQGNTETPGLAIGEHPCVIVADELFPSETLALPKHLILGIATDHGSATSHASLLARALRIPAVVGLDKLSQHVQTGDLVLLDGVNGTVTVKPDADQLQAFENLRAQAHTPWFNSVFDKRQSFEALRTQVYTDRDVFARLNQRPGVTRDGHPVPLLANVDCRTPVAELAAVKAEGIGLFRTEYQWLSLNREPTEDEQYEDYVKMAQAVGSGQRVVIRAFDLGSDKTVRDGRSHEANPSLGNRSIRFLLNAPEIFRRQLRAILRASAYGKLAVMYPMVSTLEELRAANRELTLCMDQLRAEGVAFDAGLARGVMIEVPAAALIADALSQEADFFSIGTNDLIQYTLAVDRQNEKVSRLYQPTHLAVLKLIALTVQSGLSCDCPVAVCGEMASDPVLAVLLVGLGVNELSMTPSQIPHVKYALSRVTRKEAQVLAEQVLAMSSETADSVYAICRDRLLKLVPDLYV